MLRPNYRSNANFSKHKRKLSRPLPIPVIKNFSIALIELFGAINQPVEYGHGRIRTAGKNPYEMSSAAYVVCMFKSPHECKRDEREAKQK